MIPKVIHYCWFGGSDLPEDARACIESWKKYCPGYEVLEWNEKNFDTQSNAYCREALMNRKWAFASDYVRFKVLYEHGGLYFDTDVELVKPIDDIVARGPFMGCEQGERQLVAPGLGMGASAGLELFREILDHYDTHHFVNEDGSVDETTVVLRTTDILKRHGFAGSGDVEEIAGVYVYPSDYFCPMNYWTGETTITENTRSIHHYSMSWKTETERRMKVLERKLMSRYGIKVGRQIYRVVAFVKKLSQAR